jgi:hypothetical protein
MIRGAGRASLILVCALALAACAGAVDDGGSAEEPPSAEALTGLQDQIRELLGGFTATGGIGFFPTADAAIANIEKTVHDAGYAAPTDLVYIAQVKRTPLQGDRWYHSEFLIEGALSVVGGSAPTALFLRTVGDSYGAGVYRGSYARENAGPRLCLSWAQVQTAIRASYLRGAYGLNWVCHNDTAAVLQALGIGAGYYEDLIPSWKLARIAFGSFWSRSGGVSEKPEDWAPYRQCQVLEGELAKYSFD